MTHLVVRPVLDVVVREAGGGLDAERAALDRLGTLWHERLVPVLDEVFSEIAGPGRHVRIDRLELELGTLAPDGLEDAFADAFRAALREALPRALGPPLASRGDGAVGSPPGVDPGVRPPSPPRGDGAAGAPPAPTDPAADAPPETAARDAEALTTLLRTGRLPWWADHRAPAEAFDLDAVAVRLAEAGALADAVAAAGPGALRRLAWQASAATAAAVLRAWAPDAAAVEAAVAEWRPLAVAVARDAARAEAALREAALAAARPDLAGPPPPSAAPADARSAADRVGRVAAALLAEASGTPGAAGAAALRARPEAEALPAPALAALDAAAAASSGTGRGPSPPPAPSAEPASPSAQSDPSAERARRPSGAPDDGPRPSATAPEGRAPDTAPDPIDRPGPSAPSEPDPPEADPLAADPPAADPLAADPLYVTDAGLVLLAPFLPRHFALLGLLADGRRAFADAEAARRAVALTAALATGRTAHAEPALALAKVLCGVPLAAPVGREVVRTEAERAQADDLLTSVIGHWERIGRTSVAGFREAFLLRDGRLEGTPERWALTVERRGLDVLLDSLPWGIGVVAHPWMPLPLHVAW